MKEHVIALVDCDSFFVSCEQARNPELCGKPVCVVTGGNGCVVSRSREAKKLGVKMGMPLFMAQKDFPSAIYVTADHDLYRAFSAKVMACLRQVAPEVEVVSVDEAYADLTSLDKVYKTDYFTLAVRLREKILRETKIPVSIGLAPSKLLAKLASDKAKNTGGVFQISPDTVEDVLWQTDIGEVSGIGRSHSVRMTRAGVFTALDFVRRPDAVIRKQMGIVGLDIKYELLGHYMRRLVTEPPLPQSVQATSVLPSFTADIGVIRSQLRLHLHEACRRMRKDGCFCTVAGLMLRTRDFVVVGDKCRLPAAADAEFEIARSVMPLLDNIYRPGVLYRSSGIILSGLVAKNNYQGELFTPMEFKSSPLSAAWDELEEKFGKNILKNGWL